MRTADGYIIRKCLDGDSAAFGLLVDKYKASIFALAYSKLRNFHDAEDVTQEAFIKAYKKLHTLRQWDNFYAWLYSITSNICKDLMQERAKFPESEFIEDQGIETLNALAVNSYREEMARESLHEVLDSLPEIYRQVLTLHYLGGMSADEIARFLGASPTAIRQRLSRARAKLKKEMLAMISTTFEQQKLQASFVFRIVEIVKRIRIRPISDIKGLPWGISLATGVILTVLSYTHLNPLNFTGIPGYSPLSGETKVLKVGEIPVDLVKISEMTMISGQQGKGKGGEPKQPDMQNAFFMAPRGEGGTWTKRADMPTARDGHAAIVVNGKIYVIGGYNNLVKRWLSTVEEYDPATNTWTKKADMPTARNGYASTVNGNIYVIGGGNGPAIAAVEEYDPATDTWRKKADMPAARESLSISAVNGKIYAIGGFQVWPEALSTVEEYNPATDTWTKKANMPTARWSLSTSVVDGKIYAIGGITTVGAVLSTVEEYDLATDTWTKKADMPTARWVLSTSTVNKKIYAIGGALNNNVSFATVEEYNPATDTWTKKADMPTARMGLSTGVVKGKIYAIGGSPAWVGPNLPIVEEYTPEGWPFSVSPHDKLPTTWGEKKQGR
ncbi:sigma-70 family RNA polymerase sigma factor [Candidatus Poribacteria bacterium]|nr:sigma-70 family RNA polymerase sigma factor [Candidatus Poribacteria bacterium]